MKKIPVIFIFSLLASNSLFAQKRITVKQMIEKTHCVELKCFDGFIHTKDFLTTRSAVNDVGHSYTYKSITEYVSEINPDVAHPDVIDFSFYKNGSSTIITYFTCDMEQYLFMLDEMKELGLAPIEMDGAYTFYGGNEKYKDYLIVVEIRENKKGNLKWKTFHFTITRGI